MNFGFIFRMIILGFPFILLHYLQTEIMLSLSFQFSHFFQTGRWKKAVKPKCPSTEEWIKKMWYTYTMEYYSAIKRIEIGSFVETWMDLETVIQSEEREKQALYANTYIWNLKKKKKVLMNLGAGEE